MKITCKSNWLPSIFVVLFGLTSFTQSAKATTDNQYPGEHFNLAGALELFKKSDSPESFEKALNTESNYVNNLDLNEDGEIDFVRVTNHQEGDFHAIVLQVNINASETQDIAVIEIEKTGDETALLQIIGDEDVYGKKLILEPHDEAGVGGGKGGPSVNMETAYVVVNVWGWPSVRHIYAPRYRVYTSPFVWNVRPRWHRPWRPRAYHVFQPLTVQYRPYYRIAPTHRVVRAHQVYVPKRRYSPVVRTRTTRVTTVRNRNGKVVASRKTTTVKGKRGAVRKTQTVRRKGKRRRY